MTPSGGGAATGVAVLRRIAQSLVTLLLATLLVHASVVLVPGDPIRAIWGPTRPPPRALADIRQRYHLDDPYPVQYAAWLTDVATGDLGISYPRAARGAAVIAEGTPVAATIAAAAPVSLRLLAVTVVAQLVVGVVAGAGGVAAARTVGRDTTPTAGSVTGASGAALRRLDGIVYLGAVVATAAPAILLAYLGQVVFGHRLHWLPVQGVHQGWVSYILPTVAVAAASTGYVALVTRRVLADVLREPFTVAAAARGIPEHRLIAVHGLRPALAPILTLATANLGVLVASQIIVEGVFAVPGIGSLLFDAIQRHDMPLLVPTVTLVIALIIVTNLATDILAVVADPRLRDGR